MPTYLETLTTVGYVGKNSTPQTSVSLENKCGELGHKVKCAVTVRNSANQRLSEISVSLTVLTIFMILVTEIFPCRMVNFKNGGMFDLKNLKGVKICQVNIHSIINKLNQLQLLIT